MVRIAFRSRVALALAALLVVAAAAARLEAAGSPKKDKPAPAAAAGAADPYALGMDAAKGGKFDEARAHFEKAVREKPDDPDALNMLAYTQRKTGRLPEAFANYAKALELRPNFPQAREYLGEAHLQAALEQLEALKAAGSEGATYADQLAQALHDAAAKHPAGSVEPTKSAGAEGW